jgi:ElaB/YqjD/DUF883 family membrane-anchored ribosome-binding protein
MKQHFLSGFVKAATAAGIPEDQIAALASAQGLQGAAAQDNLDAGGEPSAEEIEQMIDQLSPEEVQELLQHLEGETGNPQLPALAEAIESHVGANPQVAEMLAPQAGASEDLLAKQSAIKFIKSASYVEGFLDQALHRGIDLKTAVDLYDDAFSKTFNQLKLSALEGDQKKLDVDGDGEIEGADLKKLREGKKDEVDEKTAAYYEGMLEQARALGLSDSQTLEIVKAGSSDFFKGIADKATKARRTTEWLIKKNPKSAVGTAAATGAAAAGLAMSKKEKE